MWNKLVGGAGEDPGVLCFCPGSGSVLRLNERSPWVLNLGCTTLNKLHGRDDFMTLLFSDGNIYLRKPEAEALRGSEGVSKAARGDAILNKMPCFPSYVVGALPHHPSSPASRYQRGHMADSSGSWRRARFMASKAWLTRHFFPFVWPSRPGLAFLDVDAGLSWHFLPSSLLGAPFECPYH